MYERCERRWLTLVDIDGKERYLMMNLGRRGEVPCPEHMYLGTLYPF